MGGSIRRKVVLQGNSTLSISLPLKWAQKYGVQKGDEIDIREESDRLIVSAQNQGPHTYELIQDVSGLDPRLVDRLIARSYQKGYDKLILTHNDPTLLKIIQDKVKELIGFEIMEYNDRSCVIQSISKRIDLDFEICLRKLFLGLRYMLHALEEAYRKSDYKALEHLYRRDLEINRLAYFCLRQLSKDHFTDGEATHKGHVLYYLIESAEDLGDGLKRLAAELAVAKKKSERIEELFKRILVQYELSYSYFYSPTKEKANTAYQFNKEIRKEIMKILSSTPSKDEHIAVYYLSEATHIIYHFASMKLDLLSEAPEHK